MRHNLAIRSRAVFVATTALLVTSAIDGRQDPAPLDGTRPDPVLVSALIEAHNKERAREKLPPLKLAKFLEDAAIAHAVDMAEREKMSHEGSDGSTPQQRIVRAGYHYLNAGENVAHGYRDVKSVMQSWMDSPPHKKNVLGDFTEIGVARVKTKDGHPYWAVDFGKPYIKFDPTTASKDVIKAINDHRAEAKVPALASDVTLSRAAEKLAIELAKAQGKGPEPNQFSDLDEKQYRELAMSTASGHPDAETLITKLLESPDHKKQLLGKFTKAGIGYATAKDGVPYWCIILATPLRR